MSELAYSIIGTGNVAHFFGSSLYKSGAKCRYIYSRDIDKSKELAAITEGEFTDDISLVSDGADLVIIAVSDDAIEEVAKKIKPNKSILVHTSGNVSMKILGSYSKFYGVLYPLQSIRTTDSDKKEKVPLLIEASSDKVEKKMIGFAELVSRDYRVITSEQRRKIHLVAVLLNNFVNHLGVIAEDILNTHNLKFDVLLPLLEKTVENIRAGNALNSQTGPAIRGDQSTIDDHMKQLKPEIQRLYKAFSDSIQTRHIKDNGR